MYMRILETKNYEEMSALAADIIGAQVLLKPRCVLGLATGSSPIGTYQKLIEAYRQGRLDFSQVRTVNLDEYCGLTGDNPQSYRYFMDHQLFSQVNIPRENTFLPDGMAQDMEEESRRYEALVASLGGVDLQLLGIGHNGHIGFNEPSESYIKETHRVTLNQKTIDANSRFFASKDEVPRYAVTMGIGSIMKAKKVLLVANGAGKAEILYQSLFGPITPEVPASILQVHPDVTIVGDEEAMSVIREKCPEMIY